MAALTGAVLLTRPLATQSWQLETGLGGLLLAAAVAHVSVPGQLRPAAVALAGAALGWALSLLVSPKEFVLVGWAAIAAALVHRCPAGGPERAALLTVALAAALDAFRRVPAFAALEHGADAAFRSVSAALTWGDGEVRAGLSAWGLDIVVLGGISTWAVRPAPRAAARIVAIGALAVAAAALVHGFLGQVGTPLTRRAFVLPIWAPLFAATGAALYMAQPAKLAAAGADAGRRYATAAASVAAAALSLCAFERAVPPSRPAKSLAALEVGLQDWDTAEHGRYGVWAGGMFGRLPSECRAWGRTFERIGRARLTDEGLRSFDVLFVINLNERLTPSELDAVDRFARSGGACVVLADHTNVAGVRAPTNALIERYGISVRFDSAKSFHDWGSALGPSAVAWTCRSDDHHYFAYGTGASLDVRGDAVPVVVADRAFSDAGNDLNYVGAYLGNYAVDPGEELGGIVIAAAAPVGLGGVLVFGDTSPFQNASLSANALGYLPDLLDHLHAGPRPAWWLVVLVAAGTAGALLEASFAAARHVPAVAAAVWVAATPWLPAVQRGTLPPAPGAAPSFLFADDRPSEFSPRVPTTRTNWVLPRSAERAGLRCYYVRHLDPTICSRAAGVAVLLPRRTVPDQEGLLEFVAAGGRVLFVGGPHHAAKFDRVLGAVGVRIGHQAIGRVPNRLQVDRSLETPYLPSAYRIELSDASRRGSVELLRQGDFLFAAVVPWGRGSIAVIADDSFALPGHVEGDATWHLGNLAFVDRMWEVLLP